MTQRVGLLTSRGHPLLPSILHQLSARGGVSPVLLYDAKGLGVADRARLEERTLGALRGDIPDSTPAFEVPDHNGPDLRSLLRTENISLLANAGTPRRIATALLAAAPVVNAHPGLLPMYRGASCCEWAIYRDDPVGVSAHFMDEGLDSGPVILSRELEVRRGWSYEDVRIALYELLSVVLAEAIALVLARGLRPDTLPLQPPGEPLKPIPEELLAEVRAKLASGTYAHAH